MTSRDEIIAKVREVEALARIMFPSYASAPPLRIGFFMKGRTAGWAKYGTWTVEFNEHQMGESLAIRDLTVPHEVAHMVAHFTGLGKGHNAGWKRICRILGGDGQRCYNAAERGVTIIKGRRVTEYHYHNGSQELWLGPVHHKRLQTRLGFHVRSNSTGNRFNREHFTGKSRIKA